MKRLTALFCLLFAAYGTAVAQTSIPPDCSASDFSETGLPVMFPARNGLAMGISAKSSTFFQGEPINLIVWVNNQSDEVRNLSSCRLSYTWHVDIFDSEGRRMQSPSARSSDNRTNHEASDKEGEGSEKIWHCIRNIIISVPPHTCHPLEFGGLQEVVTLWNSDLPVGEYIVTELSTPPPSGLKIQIQGKSTADGQMNK